MMSIQNSNLNPRLTSEGFTKLPLIGTNEQREKIRLYHIDPSSEKVKAAKAALIVKLDNDKTREFKNFESFENSIQESPYLLKEGKTFRLLSQKEALELQLKYGVIGSKVENNSKNVLQLLTDIKTDEEFIAFYNKADSKTREELLPLVNTMFFIFSKKRTVLTEGEVKTLTLLGQCDHNGIQSGALSLMMSLFEEFDYLSPEYGYGLKYLIDGMPKEFFKQNQLFLLEIFDKLSTKFTSLLQTGKSINHEIEPLMASLISVGRALLNSELEKLNKETKDLFYDKLKSLYTNETYLRAIQTLSTETNYLLTHSVLWIIQHLVRITSSEHKAVTTLRKVFHGLMTVKTLAGAPLKAGTKLFLHGELPDETLVPALQEAYGHLKKGVFIKNPPKMWYEMLEETETILIDPELNVENLEILVNFINQYEVEKNKVYALLETTKLKKQDEETEEFIFGFVRQLSDVVMDHPQQTVRLKSLEILNEIFNKEKQYRDVQLLILTTLQNIIDKKNPEKEEAINLLNQLLQSHPDLKKMTLFRQTKYPCLTLLPGNSQLLNAAKTKLQAVANGSEPLPTSKFVYGSRDIKIFEQKVTIGGNFTPKGPEPISEEELIRVIQAAKELHIIAFDRNGGKVSIETKIGNLKKTVFKDEVKIDGDFLG